MTDGMTRHDVEVAIGCLDRAVHAGTGDAEVLAAIGAWRRKTGKRLVREVCEGYFSYLPRRLNTDGYVRDRRLAAENLSLKQEVANWRREAEKWHEEYERIFSVLSRTETKRLYDKVAQRHLRASGAGRRLFAANARHEVLVALASCVVFIALFLAAKWALFHALPMP